MTDTNDTPEENEGVYNPSGDVPSHPADPGYGDTEDDDAVDADDVPDDTETE